MDRYWLTLFFAILILSVTVLEGSALQKDVDPVSEEYDGCHIPNEAETGACVKAKDCKAFQAILVKEELCSNSTLNFIQAVQCESTSERRVCCPQSNAYKDAQLSKDVRVRSISMESLLSDLCHSASRQTPFRPTVNDETIAAIDEFPWVALLFYRNNRPGCSGVLVTSTFVMTAAHCLAGPKYDKHGSLNFIRLGEYNTESNPDCTVVKAESTFYEDCNDEKIDALPKSIKLHPNYNRSDIQLYNDIGLIELDRAVEFTDFLEPVTLPRARLRIGLQEKAVFQVCGWGRTNFFNKLMEIVSPIKLKASLPFVSVEDCMEDHGLDLGPGQFCAGGRIGEDSCIGDGGSPLMFYDRTHQKWVLSGIMSHGPASCRTSNKPGIYTNVRYYLPWILENIV